MIDKNEVKNMEAWLWFSIMEKLIEAKEFYSPFTLNLFSNSLSTALKGKNFDKSYCCYNVSDENVKTFNENERKCEMFSRQMPKSVPDKMLINSREEEFGDDDDVTYDEKKIDDDLKLFPVVKNNQITDNRLNDENTKSSTDSVFEDIINPKRKFDEINENFNKKKFFSCSESDDSCNESSVISKKSNETRKCGRRGKTRQGMTPEEIEEEELLNLLKLTKNSLNEKNFYSNQLSKLSKDKNNKLDVKNCDSNKPEEEEEEVEEEETMKNKMVVRRHSNCQCLSTVADST